MQKRKEEAAKARKQLLEKSKKEKENIEGKASVFPISPPHLAHVPAEPVSRLHITPVTNIACDVLYPSDALNDVEAKPQQPLAKPQQPVAKPQHLSVAK